MSSKYSYIIIGVSTVSTFLFVYLIIWVITRREEPLEDRIKRFTAWRNPSAGITVNKKGWNYILAKLGSVTPRRWRDGLDRELIRAGLPLKGGEFLIIQMIVTLLFLILGFVLIQDLLGGIISAIFGLILPRIWLKSSQKRKKNQFNNQLADTLLILANSLRAGFSLLQAMEMASQEMPNPISGELNHTLREMTFGTSTEEALQHFADRVGSADLDLLVTAILIQRQVGGNLSEVLLNIHNTIKDRLRIQQEVKTLTAQGRTSGYLIAGLPFAIAAILLIINPEYILIMFSNTLGWLMIGGGLIFQIIGFLIIRKIIAIEV